MNRNHMKVFLSLALLLGVYSIASASDEITVRLPAKQHWQKVAESTGNDTYYLETQTIKRLSPTIVGYWIKWRESNYDVNSYAKSHPLDPHPEDSGFGSVYFDSFNCQTGEYLDSYEFINSMKHYDDGSAKLTFQPSLVYVKNISKGSVYRYIGTIACKKAGL